MSHWLIRGVGFPRYFGYPENPRRWHVRLADCSREHAESVLSHLENDPGMPNGLELVEIAGLYDDPPEPEVPSRLRRLFGRFSFGVHGLGVR